MKRLVPVLLLLAACGGGADPVGPQQAEPQRLTVQAAGGEGELAALREMLDAFEQSRPGVTVDFVGVPDQGDHIAKLSTAFAGGSPPDVFLLNYRRLGPFVERGVLAPPEDVPDGLFEASVEAFTYDGELACLPQNASSSVAYLNTDLFARAGVPLPQADWTWEDLEAAARTFDGEGIAAVGFAPEVRTVAPFVWTAGGELVDDTDDPTRTTLDTPEARRALTYLAGLQQYGVDATVRAASEPVDLFEQGRLAVFVDSRRSVPAFRKAEGLSFDVRPLPRADAGTPSRTLLASDAYCVAEASDSPQLAADLATFALGPEGGAVLARSGRTVPASTALAESDDFLAPDQEPASARVFLDVLDDVRRLPNVAAQDEAEEVANDLLAQFFAGRAPLDRTVAEVDEATAAVYGRDR